ncbi:MAG: phospholipase D family protein [Clostridia bacterium]|nr:phospholipase D family protein [Clostridia bacterium]
MKKTVRTGILILIIFMISLLISSVIAPLFHKGINNEYKEEFKKTGYLSNLTCSERVLNIENNEDALLWRLRMIASAKESIVLATFDFRTDESGTDIMAALMDAADRGVDVKIIIDGIYQPVFLRKDKSFLSFCNHNNIEVRFYNSVSHIYSINYRMHDKYILVDDRMYLLGGRNTSDTFLGDVSNKSNIDRDILVYNTGEGKGDSFQQLEEYFYSIWNEKKVNTVKKKVNKDIYNREISRLQVRYIELRSEFDLDSFNAWEESTYPAKKISLLNNGTNTGRKQPRLLYAISELAENADEVIIQTPYIICNKEMYSTIVSMSENSKVSFYINAVEKGSNPFGCTDYLNNKEKILSCGATVYEVMNENALHTKTIIIDDNISVVGSYNFDMRSTYLDTELMLVIDSKELNKAIRLEIENYKEKSIEVLPDGIETKMPLYNTNELNWNKKMMYAILKILIRPFRHLL